MKIKNIVKSFNHTLAELSGLLIFVLMVLLIVDFIGRFIERPLHGLGTLSVFALVATVYLGVPLCEEEYEHIRVEALINRFPKKLTHLFNVLSYSVVVITILICLWASALNAITSFNVMEKEPGTVPMVIFPVKIIIFIGLLFYFLQTIINLMEQWESYKKFKKQ